MAVGDTTTAGTVSIAFTLQGTGTVNSNIIDIEVKPIGTSFTNTPSLTTSKVTSLSTSVSRTVLI